MTISPSYLRNIFANVSNVHTCNLRNSSVDLFIPKPKLEIGKNSLHYRGSVLWNKLPIEAREQESLDLFKSFFRDNALSAKSYNNYMTSQRAYIIFSA